MPDDGGREQRRFNRQTVIFRQIVSENQLIMRVNMNEFLRFRIEAVIVDDAGQILFGRRQSFFKSEVAGGGGKFTNVAPADKQIEVAVAAEPVFDSPVAFPMTIPNFLKIEIGEKRVD